MGARFCKCPKCAECPTSIPCSGETCLPPIFKIIAPLINNYLAKSGDTQLPQVRSCAMGTLRTIELCDLVQFQFPTKVSCDAQLTLHNILGTENSRVTQFNYYRTAEQTIDLDVELTFGVLTGRLSLTPTEENCGFSGHFTSKAFTCPNSTLILGTPEMPCKIQVSFSIPAQCEKPSQVSIRTLVVTLGPLNSDCFAFLQYLPESIKAKISETLAQKAQAFLKIMLNDMVQKILHQLFEQRLLQ